VQLDAAPAEPRRERRRQRRRGVDDEDVAGGEEPGEVAKSRVGQRAVGAPRDQQGDVGAVRPALLGRLGRLERRCGGVLDQGAATASSEPT
jgi:hypothetical protein